VGETGVASFGERDVSSALGYVCFLERHGSSALGYVCFAEIAVMDFSMWTTGPPQHTRTIMIPGS
jgi:hypothetical protein